MPLAVGDGPAACLCGGAVGALAGGARAAVLGVGGAGAVLVSMSAVRMCAIWPGRDPGHAAHRGQDDFALLRGAGVAHMGGEQTPPVTAVVAARDRCPALVGFGVHVERLTVRGDRRPGFLTGSSHQAVLSPSNRVLNDLFID